MLHPVGFTLHHIDTLVEFILIGVQFMTYRYTLITDDIT